MRAALKSLLHRQAVRWPAVAITGWILLSLVAQYVWSKDMHSMMTARSIGLIAMGGVVAAAIGFGSDTAGLSVKRAARQNFLFAITASTTVFLVGLVIAAFTQPPAETYRIEYIGSWVVFAAWLFGISFFGRWCWGRV
jgi:hypothetical protein